MSLIEPIMLAVGVGGMGVVLGWFLGIKEGKKARFTPSAEALREVIKDNERHYKVMIGRSNERLREYEQPSEFQRLAQDSKGAAPENIVAMLANELPNMRGLPKWLRPLIPGIQSYLKENPEQVMELVNKFMSKTKDPDAGGAGDYL